MNTGKESDLATKLQQRAFQLIRDHASDEEIRNITHYSPAVIKAMRDDYENGRIRLHDKKKGE